MKEETLKRANEINSLISHYGKCKIKLEHLLNRQLIHPFIAVEFYDSNNTPIIKDKIRLDLPEPVQHKLWKEAIDFCSITLSNLEKELEGL